MKNLRTLFSNTLQHALQHFLALFGEAAGAGRLIKCTLSKPAAAADGLKNIYLRPVLLKAGPRIAFTFRYQTRDEVKHFTAAESLVQLENLLGKAFLNADLFTPDQDATLSFQKNGSAQIVLKKPIQT